MKKGIVTAIIIASISSAFAQYSQSVAMINPWAIKYESTRKIKRSINNFQIKIEDYFLKLKSYTLCKSLNS